MRIEDLQNEFPGMPERMRIMVEREVEKQLNTTETIHIHRKKGRMRKTLIAALVAVMALGTTVAAGAVYYLRSEPVGEYGMKVKTESNDIQEEGNTPESGTDILPVKMELAYLPEGLVQTEDAKYSYEDTLNQGGISLCLYRMDTGDDQFEMHFQDVVTSEDITVNGHNGVYLEFHRLIPDELTFNQRIYVTYTDVHYVLEMFVGSDMAKEEAIKIAEGITLTPVQSGEGESCIKENDWSAYLASLEEMESVEEDTEALSVSREKMGNTHAVGEAFGLSDTYCEYYPEYAGLSIKVADVQVADNVGLLDLSQLDADGRQELERETDGSGKLLPAKINYVKDGDGIDTVSEIVKTGEATQKLVYATVEYTNTGDRELTDVIFFGSLMRFRDTGDQVKFYDGEEPGAEDVWDVALSQGVCRYAEMYYYDVHGGERGNNHIASIKPGETVTVHMGWIVQEKELGYLYLNLNPAGNSYGFDEDSLAVGYVDIRQ